MRRRKSLDKIKQWSWAEDTHPDDINDTHIKKVFHLEYPRCKPLSVHRTCVVNPFCLSALGEQHWLQNKDSPIVDPELECRQTNNFCGLKNLGATCYINSLLQLWFHNINIKEAILNWNPEEDENEKLNQTLFIKNGYEPVTAVGHLQLVFALMQFGKQQTVNPEAFIKSLKIDTSIEQDAEEFSNLLLTTLERRFEKQTNPSVREMVKKNFLGEYKSVITCLTCKTESACSSTFRDLSLNIEGHKTLHNSLQDYLKEEVLAGEDQYYCNKCKAKQNAVRQMCLTALPSVLNFQLMRFVYNRQSMQKIKLNTFIRFPQTLNMRQYLNLPDELNTSSSKNYKYNLYAVLKHKGSSANCGHYVAQIKDKTTKQWYQFNDDKVDKLTPKGLNLCTDDDIKNLKPTKYYKVYKEEFQTNDAYMLVYMKDTNTKQPKARITTCKFSPRLTQLVNTHNNEFEKKILKANNGKVFVKKMLNLINFTKGSQMKEGDNGEAISLQWMKYLFQVNPNETVKKINNNPILCKHNLVDPNKIHEVKYISSELADKLYRMYEGGPRLKLTSSLCHVCVRNKCALMYTNTLISKHNESITKILDQWGPTNNSDVKNEETGYWVGNETLKCWQRMYYKSFETYLKKCDVLPTTTLPINHEILSTIYEPSSSLYEVMKTINGDAEQKNIKMVDVTENTIKPECSTNAVGGESTSKPEGEENFLEYDYFREIYKYDCLQTIDNTPWRFNGDIICLHGNMTVNKDAKTLVPEEVKNIFETYFPKASLFDKATKPCFMCRNVQMRVMVCKITRKSLAKIENLYLFSLLWNQNRSVFSIESSPYACVPRKFLEALRKFIKTPLDEPIPKLIRNKSLLCDDHNKLVYDPVISLNPSHQNDYELVLVTKFEWKSLLHCYEADLGVFVYFDEQRVFKSSKPEICETCCQKKLQEENINQLKYSNEKIFIQVDDIENQNGMSGNCPKKFKRDTMSTNDSEIASININDSTSHNGARKSEQKQNMPKQSVFIEVSSNDTVLHLKLKIMDVFHVMPSNQCLKTTEGLELLNNEATLEDLNIFPQSVILAQFNEQKVHKSEINTNTVEETGFKGTELMR